MFELSLVEFWGRALPEGFLFVFSLYAFSKTAINKRNYLVSSILMGVLIFIVKLLPIHYGVHTILNIILLIILSVNINRISIIKSIQGAITLIILQFICEGVNVFIIQYIFKADMKYIFSDSILKTLYGIPSLIIFAVVMGVYYFILFKRKRLKHV